MSVVGPKRVTGFMQLAKEVIIGSPGLTAQEVYQKVRNVAKTRGVALSAATNPESSLVATLHKHHRQYDLERSKQAGHYRFFPKQVTPTPHSPLQPVNDDCCLDLSLEDTKRIKALVELGRYANKHDAYRGLIKTGLDTLLSKLSA